MIIFLKHFIWLSFENNKNAMLLYEKDKTKLRSLKVTDGVLFCALKEISLSVKYAVNWIVITKPIFY